VLDDRVFTTLFGRRPLATSVYSGAKIIDPLRVCRTLSDTLGIPLECICFYSWYALSAAQRFTRTHVELSRGSELVPEHGAVLFRKGYMKQPLCRGRRATEAVRSLPHFPLLSHGVMRQFAVPGRVQGCVSKLNILLMGPRMCFEAKHIPIARYSLQAPHSSALCIRVDDILSVGIFLRCLGRSGTRCCESVFCCSLLKCCM